MERLGERWLAHTLQYILLTKASEFLCPELVSTDTDDDNDDDDLMVAGSEYELHMHTTMATPTFSSSRRSAEQMERVHMAMYSKKRTDGSFCVNTYFPPWKMRDLDTRLHAI